MEKKPDSEVTYHGGAALLSFIQEIEEGASRILDFGCGSGDTLMRLKNERRCTDLYGVDIREEHASVLRERLKKTWILNLEEDQAELDEEFLDFFNYILLLDVVEHLYDPWYLLPKLAKYLSSSGKIIISTPNFRHWALWFNIIIGQFPYGKTGGLMNEEHIRWFTFDSLKELIALSGLRLLSAQLVFPPNIDVAMMTERMKSPIPELVIPPPETSSVAQPTIIRFSNIKDISSHYPYFLANKIIAICGRGAQLAPPERTRVGVLEERRKRLLG